MDAKFTYIVQLTLTVLDNLPAINMYVLNLEDECPTIRTRRKSRSTLVSTTLWILQHPGVSTLAAYDDPVSGLNCRAT